ncbi:MAG: hypothetical protein DDT26_02172 [Dehalococcoidia bacterium]|nr:hypothetical protein [Chloroflexota bacterium]
MGLDERCQLRVHSAIVGQPLHDGVAARCARSKDRARVIHTVALAGVDHHAMDDIFTQNAVASVAQGVLDFFLRVLACALLGQLRSPCSFTRMQLPVVHVGVEGGGRTGCAAAGATAGSASEVAHHIIHTMDRHHFFLGLICSVFPMH